ncbi:MAG: hypothetical protein JNM83_03155 [Myxococcales bacterium]|nr:hypothetical protein [Myxococcales bacterium]
MGCSTCKTGCGTSDGGCSTQKSAQRLFLDDLLPRLYPSRTYGQLDVQAAFEEGLKDDECELLGRRIATVTKAPVYLIPPEDDELCRYLYVLCVGREPPLVELRRTPQLLRLEADHIRERYLRVALSTVARVACVQEVAMELDLSPGGDGSLAVVRELPRGGVFDPLLLKRLQRIVDLLTAYDIRHLDLGVIEQPASGLGLADDGFAGRFGCEPRLGNFLFFAAPAVTTCEVHLPVAVTAPVTLARA